MACAEGKGCGADDQRLCGASPRRTFDSAERSRMGADRLRHLGGESSGKGHALIGTPYILHPGPVDHSTWTST